MKTKVCVRERERESVSKREILKEGDYLCVSVCVCLCVCMFASRREKERETCKFSLF